MAGRTSLRKPWLWVSACQLKVRAMHVQDSRAAVRVPFTQIVPTVVKVVDTSNEGSSGAGWTIGEGGLVRALKSLI